MGKGVVTLHLNKYLFILEYFVSCLTEIGPVFFAKKMKMCKVNDSNAIIDVDI